MSRGDQRERDRAKNLAKQQAKSKAQGKGGDVLKRNENDKAALQAKIEAKKAMKEKQAEDAVKEDAKLKKAKKPPPKKDTMDDLLSAGLAGNKKKKRT